METLYDKLSTVFIFLVLIWLLILTSGFVNAIPGLFNIVNRGEGRDTTRFNDIKIYNHTKAKAQSTNHSKGKLTLTYGLFALLTLIVFIATVISGRLGL